MLFRAIGYKGLSNYLTLQLFELERTWLFQKRVMRIKLNIHIFLKDVCGEFGIVLINTAHNNGKMQIKKFCFNFRPIGVCCERIH